VTFSLDLEKAVVSKADSDRRVCGRATLGAIRAVLEEMRHRGSLWFPLSLVFLVGLGLLWRLAAWNPPSLWLDDQWVGVVVTRMSMEQFIELRPPLPLGLAVLFAWMRGLFRDPEWSLQLLPMIASIAQVPLMALLVARATGRRSAGFLAGALLLINPLLGTYGVRPKPYAFDGLFTVLLLLAGLPLLKEANPRRLALFALAGLVSLLFSFTSIFVSALCVNLALAADLLRQRRERPPWRAGLIVLVFDASVWLVYVLLLREHGNQALRAYWAGGFLPLGSLEGLLAFLKIAGWGALSGAFPGPLCFLTVLVIPGLAGLLWRASSRTVGIFFGLFYLQLLATSALGIYPLQGGRASMFTYPITLFLACAGLVVLTSFRRVTALSAIATCLLAAAALYWLGEPSRYPPGRDAELVRALQEEVRPGDGVLVWPLASEAIGYYSDWPITLQRQVDPRGFGIELVRRDTLNLPQPPELAGRLDGLLHEFLARDHDRILYFWTNLLWWKQHHDTILASLESSRYARVAQKAALGGGLVVYVRPPTGADRRQ